MMQTKVETPARDLSAMLPEINHRLAVAQTPREKTILLLIRAAIEAQRTNANKGKA